MKKYWILLVAALTLPGCIFDEAVITKEERVGMEVIKVEKRSKGKSKLSFKVLGVNQVYTEQYTRCRYKEIKDWVVGTKWDIVVQHYKYGDRYGSRLMGLDAICDTYGAKHGK